MDSIVLFISTLLIVYSGFTFWQYGKLAKKKIDFMSYMASSNNIDIMDEGNVHEYAKKFEEWKSGNFFHSGLGLLIGPLLVFGGAMLNFIENSWWTVPLALVIGYVSYLQLALILKWKVQLLSFFILIFGTILFFLK